MPAGQTPVTVTVVAHNDLVDAVQPGDRYVYILRRLIESKIKNLVFK
jgi:hypothetical protein